MIEIPYESQIRSGFDRMCGAAALRMVYRSFGIDATQEELWPRVSKQDRWGRCATTRLLACDAIERGLSAVIVQCKDPWKSLESGLGSGERLIVNHRLAANSAAGHYSVVVAVGEHDVVLHDPRTGPTVRVARDSFLSLWRPYGPRSEICGTTLIAFALPKTPSQKPCGDCGRSAPATLKCPNCGRRFLVHPTGTIGCFDAHCPLRLWRSLFCSFCDHAVDEASSDILTETRQ